MRFGDYYNYDNLNYYSLGDYYIKVITAHSCKLALTMLLLHDIQRKVPGHIKNKRVNNTQNYEKVTHTA